LSQRVQGRYFLSFFDEDFSLEDFSDDLVSLDFVSDFSAFPDFSDLSDFDEAPSPSLDDGEDPLPA
jgi:hypothetical protein